MTSTPPEEHFDYVIIGSGRAGRPLLTGWRLPDNPVSQ